MKRTFFYFLLCWLLTPQLWAQTISFSPKADVPEENGLDRCFSFALNGKVYAGTGRDADAIMNNRVWEYDPATDTWTQKNDFPTVPQRNAFGLVINGIAYAGFGWDGGVTTWDPWFQYDPSSDTWISKSNPLDAGVDVGGFSATFELNGKGYFVCGSGANAEMNKVAEYDPATDTWTQKNDFPGEPRDFAFGEAIDGYGYVGMGDFFFAPPFYSDCYKYAPTADTWSPITPIPGLESGTIVEGACHTSFVHNEKLVLMNIILQSTSISEVTTLYVYDPPTDSWLIYEGAYPVDLVRATHISGKIGDKIYYGAGFDANGIHKDFWEIDLSNLVTGLQETMPELENLWATAEGCNVSVSVPAEVYQQLGDQQLNLHFYTLAGQNVATYKLSDHKHNFDLSSVGTGALVWTVYANGKPLRSSKILLNK